MVKPIQLLHLLVVIKKHKLQPALVELTSKTKLAPLVRVIIYQFVITSAHNHIALTINSKKT